MPTWKAVWSAVPFLRAADEVWALQPDGLPWDLGEVLGELPACTVSREIDVLVAGATAGRESGDCVVVMSNGGFGGIHELLCQRLESLHARD